jgi:HAE1 family hydrophobic/amphiphilic exporter-1
MLLLIAVAFGILSIFNISLDMMPNMNIPIAIVMTTYSGAGPLEIETLVTKPMEGALGTVPKVSEISSMSSYGSSIVIVQFEDDTDIDNAALDMRERVDMIKPMLPEDAGTPTVLKIDINSMASFTLGFSSESADLVELKRLVEDRVVNRMERQDGVASVSLSGGSEKEVSVVLNEESLRGYGISESAIVQLLMMENRSSPTGSIKQGDKRLNLRVSGEFQTVGEIGDIPIATARGATVHLRDVAEISETLTESSSVSYINGEPSVTLTIQKQSTANTVSVSDAVMGELALIQKDIPGLHVRVILDPAEYIRLTLSTVAKSALQGAALAVIILFVFLRNVRSTLIVGTAIPVSVVATFALMYYTNMTLNVMSLGGLALGIGMLVDNSIVVMESIYRKIEEGERRVAAAIEGAREVAVSVTASTLTTIAVFLPISFAGGLTAQIFNQLSMTISFSLISSLAVSLTFVPMACSVLLREQDMLVGGRGMIGGQPQGAIADAAQGMGASAGAIGGQLQGAVAGAAQAQAQDAMGGQLQGAGAVAATAAGAAVGASAGTMGAAQAQGAGMPAGPDGVPGQARGADAGAAPAAASAGMAAGAGARPPGGRRRRKNPITALLYLFGRAIDGLESVYKRMLAFCLRRRKLTVLITLAFIAFTYAMFAMFVGMEFMPASDEGSISVNVAMPKGSLLEETEKAAFQAVEAIESGGYPEIEDITLQIGSGGGLGSGGGMMSLAVGGGSSDSASISINLVGKAERSRSAEQIADLISARLTGIAGAEITAQSSGQSLGAYSASGVSLTIKGDDIDTLNRIADDVRGIVAAVPGTREAETSFEEAAPQATLHVNRDKASIYGISAYSISGIINTAISGSVSTTFRAGDGSEMDIRVRQSGSDFNYLTDLENILIPSPTGASVPLYELADIELSEAPTTIRREAQQRYVSVSATLEGRDIGSVMQDVSAGLAAYPIPPGYTVEESGSAQQMNETFADLGLALAMAVAIVYMIMAAEFESLLYPFIIMFSIPIAMTGGLFGLFVFGDPLSITGFLGLIMLAGLVINNAIVLIDYTNLLIRERGMEGEAALLLAGPVRMRPILMTTLTTVLGLLPMAFATSDGAEMMRGLAVVVVFGLSLSTLVTLLFVPVVYIYMHDKLVKRAARKEARLARGAGGGAAIKILN